MVVLTPLDENAQTRLAMAGLFAALAKALDATDPTFAERFRAELKGVYDQFEDFAVDPPKALETLKWAYDLAG